VIGQMKVIYSPIYSRCPFDFTKYVLLTTFIVCNDYMVESCINYAKPVSSLTFFNIIFYLAVVRCPELKSTLSLVISLSNYRIYFLVMPSLFFSIVLLFNMQLSRHTFLHAIIFKCRLRM
jgi:hypothetical protein